MAKKIKCPFCGSMDTETYNTYIGCIKCMAISANFDSIEQAIASWEHRVMWQVFDTMKDKYGDPEDSRKYAISVATLSLWKPWEKLYRMGWRVRKVVLMLNPKGEI